MLQTGILEMLRCPDDHSSLATAGTEIVERVNDAIRDGWMVNRAGKRVEHLIDGGLMRADGQILYPVYDGIPVLLRDDGIPLVQLSERAIDGPTD